MILPEDTMLGKLNIGVTYEYYDCPRLFTCKNEYNQYYVAVSVEDIDTEMIWLYVRVSSNRLDKKNDTFLK